MYALRADPRMARALHFVRARGRGLRAKGQEGPTMVAVRLEDLPSWRAQVLIAISDPADRGAIERALQRDGHRVTVVEDGVELLDRLSDEEGRRDIQLVIADV